MLFFLGGGAEGENIKLSGWGSRENLEEVGEGERT